MSNLNERSQMTLKSIDDAVLSTDSTWHVKTQRRPRRANLLLKLHALTLAISGYVRDITPTTKSTVRLLMKGPAIMTQLPNGMEHRRAGRIQVDLPVMVSADRAERIRGCMRNLSLSGALLRIDADLHLHALIEVCVELPTPSRHPARLLAHVSRRWEEEVGIEWCEFSPNLIKDLLRSPTMWISLYVVVAFRRAAERILSKSQC
jgi:hypothetical protein